MSASGRQKPIYPTPPDLSRTSETGAYGDIRQLAQNLARNRGWAVFPCSEAKTPTWPRREGGQGYKDASADPEHIAWLWRHWPGPLIGVATGEISGFDVLDVDVKHNAARAWLTNAQHTIPPTRTYRTRGGGFHLLFQHIEGVHNTESHIAIGIDTRGTGGYVVFWFASGFQCVDDSPIGEWPDWLLEALFFKPEPEPPPAKPSWPYRSNGQSAQNIILASLRKLENAPEGQRHKALRAASCAIGGVLAAAGMPKADAKERLLHAVVLAGGDRVDQKNAKATIDWGLAKGTQTPLALGAR
jgi:hypothetical protein